MRNAGHKSRHAGLFAQAQSDKERLAAAYAWFLASALLLARRRTPLHVDQEVHRTAAAGLIRDAAGYLATLAQAIDRGDYDAGKAA